MLGAAAGIKWDSSPKLKVSCEMKKHADRERKEEVGAQWIMGSSLTARAYNDMIM